VIEWLSIHLVQPVRFADAIRQLYPKACERWSSAGARCAQKLEEALRTSISVPSPA
jgi:hypothetical protein